MYISMNWINDYVDLSGIETEEIVKRFNLSTAEIEGYEECLFKLDGGSDYKHFCVGDSGIIFTLISKENIVNNHFEEAKVDWDCC
jgi:uncharacterized protein YwqG